MDTARPGRDIRSPAAGRALAASSSSTALVVASSHCRSDLSSLSAPMYLSLARITPSISLTFLSYSARDLSSSQVVSTRAPRSSRACFSAAFLPAVSSCTRIFRPVFLSSRSATRPISARMVDPALRRSNASIRTASL